MIYKNAVVAIALGLGIGSAQGQWDDLVHIPAHAQQRIADDMRLGPTTRAAQEIASIELPIGTYQVDLINGRGRVVRSYQAERLQELELGTLRPGTWTLRARTSESYSVRRFMVIKRGTIMWSQPRTAARN